MSVVISIQARMGSTRLPGKVLLPLGNKRVLAWTVDRADAAEAVDQTIVATGDRACNTAIETWCGRTGRTCFVGPEDDLLERHRTVADRANSDILVRITGDSPFVSPDEIDRLVCHHRTTGADYTTNYTNRMPVGMIVDVINAGVLDELAGIGESHPVAYLRNSPDEYRITFTSGDRWDEISDAPLEVNTPKQYWDLTDALNAVGPGALALGRWLLANRL